VTRTVAAFDFDGTLTRRDTLLPFLASVSGWPRVAAALPALVPNARDRDAAKQALLQRVLGGREHNDIRLAGERFGEKLARGAVTPEMRARVAWHQDEGHEIVIVSATLDVYLDPAARELAIDDVLCTRLDVADDGRCTGRIEGANCRGQEKAARLRSFLGDADDIVVWAYGNSAGDREMLALAQYPVMVRRGRLR
jgi:HAD superfamily hydrolase (TIGR01490 family)